MQLLLLAGALLPQVELKQIDPQKGRVEGERGVHLSALHPSCQRVREDGRPSSHSTLLSPQSVSQVHFASTLPLPAAALLLLNRN